MKKDKKNRVSSFQMAKTSICPILTFCVSNRTLNGASQLQPNREAKAGKTQKFLIFTI
jgi:hypothetical protein